MTEKQWKDAFDSIKPDQGQSERIWARLMESEDAGSPEKQIVAKPLVSPLGDSERSQKKKFTQWTAVMGCLSQPR